MTDKPLPAYEGDEPFVFVSYAHADKAGVYPEIRWLQDQGVHVWYDEGIGGASRWRDAIASRLGGCRLMLFYVSGASVASQVCREELEFVLDLHKPILPVHLEPTELPDGVRLAISNRQALLRDRLESDDYARKLLGAIATHIDTELAEPGDAPIPWRKPRRLSLASATGLGLLASLLAAWTTYAVLDVRRANMPKRTGAAELVRFSIPLREDHDLHYGDCFNAEGPQFQGRYPTTALAFSHDGSKLLIAARDLATDTQQLYLRRLDSGELRPVPGTEGGYGARFTPGDRWIGFFDGRYLKRVPVAGGDAEIIVQSPLEGCLYLAPAWTDEKTQYQSVGTALVRFDAAGSVEPNLAPINPGQEYGGYLGLHVLPGGDTVLLHQLPQDEDPVHAAIFAVRPDSGERVRVLEDAMHPFYLERTGHLLFLRRGTLMAAPFDPDSLDLGGEPFVVQTGIMQAVGMHNSRFETGEGQLALSQAGHLAYLPGDAEPSRPTQMFRVATDGSAEPFGAPSERELGQLRMSPSGDRLLFATRKAGGRGFTTSILDITRDVAQTLNTGGYQDHWFAWSPDGNTIAYSSAQDGVVANVHTLRLDGKGSPQRVAPSSEIQFVADWAPDGSIVYLQGGDIWRLPPAAEAHALFTSDVNEAFADVSPDGKWVAYAAAYDNANPEVFVRPFPGPGNPILISNDGQAPAWSNDGKMLYYLTTGQEGAERQMMAVEMQAGMPSPARRVMDWPYEVFIPQRQFDVLPDGSFIAGTVAALDEPYRAERIEVVLNLATLLEQRSGGAEIEN